MTQSAHSALYKFVMCCYWSQPKSKTCVIHQYHWHPITKLLPKHTLWIGFWCSWTKPEWKHSLDKCLAPENWWTTSSHLFFFLKNFYFPTFFFLFFPPWIHSVCSIISILLLDLPVLWQRAILKLGFPRWPWKSEYKPVFFLIASYRDTISSISRSPHCNKMLIYQLKKGREMGTGGGERTSPD